MQSTWELVRWHSSAQWEDKRNTGGWKGAQVERLTAWWRKWLLIGRGIVEKWRTQPDGYLAVRVLLDAVLGRAAARCCVILKGTPFLWLLFYMFMQYFMTLFYTHTNLNRFHSLHSAPSIHRIQSKTYNMSKYLQFINQSNKILNENCSFSPDKYIFVKTCNLSFEFKSSWKLLSFRLKSGGLGKSTAHFSCPIPYRRMFKYIWTSLCTYQAPLQPPSNTHTQNHALAHPGPRKMFTWGVVHSWEDKFQEEFCICLSDGPELWITGTKNVP